MGVEEYDGYVVALESMLDVVVFKSNDLCLRISELRLESDGLYAQEEALNAAISALKKGREL